MGSRTPGRQRGNCSATASGHTLTITAVVSHRWSLVSTYTSLPTLLKECRANGNGIGDRLRQTTNVGGLRFANVEIPSGARIDAAYIEAYVYHSDDPRLYLFAEAADDAADFSARRPDLSGRGEAFTRWEGDDIGEGWRPAGHPGRSALLHQVKRGWYASPVRISSWRSSRPSCV